MIVGDNPYHPEYVQQLKDSADERVLFLGGEFGEAGLAFFRNDVSDLAGLLRGLLANPKWVRQLGAAAQARARELYDWDRITDQHEQLFWSVLERRRARRWRPSRRSPPHVSGLAPPPVHDNVQD